MRYVLFTIAVVGVIIGLLSIDGLNRAAIFGSSGYINSGSKFGIRVGMDESRVVRKMKKRGLRVHSVTPTPAVCIYREYAKNKLITALYDETWRRGTICLISEDGRIASVEWQYGLLIP